ncbi:PKD domain-containing protein [Myxococcota bacterium]|nr:PKD domain-containing protein [Myxococcota bacterium]
MRPWPLLILLLHGPAWAGEAGGTTTPGLLDELWVDAGGPYVVDAGASTTLDASGSQLDACARAEFAWDLDGDGLVDTAATSSPTQTFDATDLDGPQARRVHVQVTCWLIDELASIDGSDEAELTVHNVPPAIGRVDRESIPREGTPFTLEVIFTDPEAADTHEISWDLGDGGTATGPVISHAWVQDGPYDLTVTVTDDDGDADSFQTVVEVTNLPPILSGQPTTQAQVDQPWSFTPVVTDAGLADTHSFAATLPPGALLDAETGALTWTPTLDDLGAWDLSLSVEDEAGDGDTMLWTLTVSEDLPTEPDTGSGGGRPFGDGHARPDPWEGVYTIAGEGCRCAAGAPGATGLGLLALVTLAVGRRRRS